MRFTRYCMTSHQFSKAAPSAPAPARMCMMCVCPLLFLRAPPPRAHATACMPRWASHSTQLLADCLSRYATGLLAQQHLQQQQQQQQPVPSLMAAAEAPSQAADEGRSCSEGSGGRGDVPEHLPQPAGPAAALPAAAALVLPPSLEEAIMRDVFFGTLLTWVRSMRRTGTYDDEELLVTVRPFRQHGGDCSCPSITQHVSRPSVCGHGCRPLRKRCPLAVASRII